MFDANAFISAYLKDNFAFVIYTLFLLATITEYHRHAIKS